MPRIAIIGAGIAGLACADTLCQSGCTPSDLVIFDKSRGLGGRMATRYAGDFEFDHGAQYFTAGSERFETWLERSSGDGVVANWAVDIETLGGARARDTVRYVAAPRMNALCKEIAKPFEVKLGTRITGLIRTNGWEVEDDAGELHGPFDYVVSAIPQPQMRTLMPDTFGNHTMLANVRMAGCFSLMLGFEVALDMPWTAARIDQSPVGWVAVNSDKPGRETGYSILVQSSNVWAETNLEAPLEEVEATLLQTASDLCGVDLSMAAHKALHRWRYAATPQPLGLPFLLDDEQGLAACGDWCLGSRVEAAFESGAALGDAIGAIL